MNLLWSRFGRSPRSALANFSEFKVASSVIITLQPPRIDWKRRDRETYFGLWFKNLISSSLKGFSSPSDPALMLFADENHLILGRIMKHFFVVVPETTAASESQQRENPLKWKILIFFFYPTTGWAIVDEGRRRRKSRWNSSSAFGRNNCFSYFLSQLPSLGLVDFNFSVKLKHSGRAWAFRNFGTWRVGNFRD